MKRGQTQPVTSSLSAALDKARGLISGAQLDARAPSMQVPSSNLGIEANDAAIELPDIIDHNDNAGFYPAQDGYARNPQSEAERRLARQSQYGTDWGSQQRQTQLLLDKDPGFRLIKAIAGATQRPIDRFIQGPNQELIDIQRQRAIDRSRREILLYEPQFEELEARIASLTEKQTNNKKRADALNAGRADINTYMAGVYAGTKYVNKGFVNYEYGNAKTAHENGAWWVLPPDIQSFEVPQYSNVSIDLEKLFAGDSLEVVSVYDFAMVPRNDYRGFAKSTTVAAGKADITVVPYVYAVYTMGLLETMKTYLTENAFSVMSVRQLLMMSFLLMNGGSYSTHAYEEFERQFAKCDPVDIQSLTDESERKKNVVKIVSENLHKRAMNMTGDLNAAIRATLNLNYTTERNDMSLFYGVSGVDSMLMYRQQPTRDINADQKKLLDTLKIFSEADPEDGVTDAPITLLELCRRSETMSDTLLRQSLDRNINSFTSVIDSFKKDHSANLFQALLYFAGYFTGFAGLRTLDSSRIVDEMRMIENVTKWTATRSPNTRGLVESFPEPVSPFTVKDNLKQPVVLSSSGISILDVVHLRVFISSVRKIMLNGIDDVTEEATTIALAIQAAQQRLIAMTRDNYDTINRQADKLILEGDIDPTPSLHSMGNSIDYATQPQNIGLIVLTPLAHYGIWAAYEVLQNRNIYDNRIAGLPFDEIIRHSGMSVFFAKFVAALLANTGLATGAGYQAQVRSARIPYELESAATEIFSFAYSVVGRDPLTGVRLEKPIYKIYRKTARSGGAVYLLH